MAERTVITSTYTVTIVRRKRFLYEWSVEGPARRVHRGVAVSAGRARRATYRVMWEPFFSMFEREERVEAQVVRRRSMVLAKDPEPLEKELLGESTSRGPSGASP